MCYFVYILYSVSRDRYYIGYTASLQGRLEKHNQKHVGFTGRIKDWKLVWSEGFETKAEAMRREKQFKSWKSRTNIEALINTL